MKEPERQTLKRFSFFEGNIQSRQVSKMARALGYWPWPQEEMWPGRLGIKERCLLENEQLAWGKECGRLAGKARRAYQQASGKLKYEAT